MTEAAPESIAALDGIVAVSHETKQKLDAFVALLRKWQAAENLISPKTLSEIWTRHVADSAQLVSFFPEARNWLDLGSGGGFPGLVVALVGQPGTHVHLVESNVRKCAFLRTAIRETGAQATAHEGRAQAIVEGWQAPIDRISARAVASLCQLLALAEPLMTRGVPAAFHKGEDFRREVAEASHSFAFNLVEHPSRVGEGVILDITNLRRKPRQA